jgi:hypothetical protein
MAHNTWNWISTKQILKQNKQDTVFVCSCRHQIKYDQNNVAQHYQVNKVQWRVYKHKI